LVAHPIAATALPLWVVQPFGLYGSYGVGRIPLDDEEFAIPAQCVVELRFPASLPVANETRLKSVHKVCVLPVYGRRVGECDAP
jgi:hypothetical protein